MNKGVLALRAASAGLKMGSAIRAGRKTKRESEPEMPMESGEGRLGWRVSVPGLSPFWARTKKELPRLPEGTVFEQVRFTDEELEDLPGVPAEAVF